MSFSKKPKREYQNNLHHHHLETTSSRYNSIKNEGVEEPLVDRTDLSLTHQLSHFSRNRNNTLGKACSASVGNLLKPIEYHRLISLSHDDLEED
jgi:hypothetical protein